MPPTHSLILSHPTPVTTVAASVGNASRSWIQVARTGSFVSKRYGTFAITRDDLAQMLHNFTTVTPAAPTELPVDFDHLSMAPRQPGDGIAAGWVKRLELRDHGDELWAEVEWTPRAAAQIAAREYRFISPSFVKNHTHKDGRQIGTTLLAAALTNHPFLEQMQSVVLSADPSLTVGGRDVAILTPTVETFGAALHLAEPGQRVSFKPDAELTPELTDAERQQTFVVTAVRGPGDAAFVRLATLDGREFGWFSIVQVAPAPLAFVRSPFPHPAKTLNTARQTPTAASAATFSARVLHLAAGGHTIAAAMRLASTTDRSGAEAYRCAGVGRDARRPQAPAEPTRSSPLTDRDAFSAQCLRYASEHRVTVREAVRAVSVVRPDVTKAW